MILDKPILGIIGGGQLGSMLCQAAKKLNISTIILTDDKDAPAHNICDEFIYSDYSNKENIEKFARSCHFITFEFENIPYEILEKISNITRVNPAPDINKIIQNRFSEKNFLKTLGIATTTYAFIKSNEDIEKNKNLLPGILKTCTLGYDGKGQFVIQNLQDAKNDWCFTADYILEKFINLKQEISIIITRFKNGDISIFEPIENIHKDQILQTSTIPANISPEIFSQAQAIAKQIADKLEYVGTMCVEYFIDQKNNLYVNEIAPRVHNSGHLTINAFNVSQFENHVRAICNLPKIELEKKSDAKMLNIIGKEITDYRQKKLKENDFFFDYLKKEIKDKRKMGHLTILTNKY
jgi:5-(carboxyamino)imidazole ribonucleotide synthase